MLRNSLRRWIGSKFATSWQLMLVLVANYILNGQLFAGVSPVKGGPPGVVFDIYNSVSICLVLLLFRLFSQKASYRRSLIAWASASALANLPLLVVVPILFPEVDVAGASYRDFVVMALSGFVQMIAVQALFAVLIASFSEARSARKALAVQRAKLDFLKTQLGSQLNEIKDRLRSDVLEKLDYLLSALSEHFKNSVDSKQLAQQVAATLDSGVRPLSWQVEAQNENSDEVISAKPSRPSLLERMNFKLRIADATSPAAIVTLMVTFDIPLIYFVFGLESAMQGLLVICFIYIALLLYRRIFGAAQVFSFVAVSTAGAIAAFVGTGFIWIRYLSGELTSDLAELGVVFSFAQISLAVTWFGVILNRREVSLRLSRLANEHLEILVSALRQNVWLEKSRLAKLVHGPVQSKLFAVYLDLTRQPEIDRQKATDLAAKISSASEDLKLENSDSSLRLEEAIAIITSGWGDSLAFEIDVEPGAGIALNSDLVAKACSVEVLREAVNNAAKHGGQGVINIRIQFTNSRLVEIQVRNSLSNPNDSVTPGYGSRVLDEVTHNWNLSFEDTLAVFTALIALK